MALTRQEYQREYYRKNRERLKAYQEEHPRSPEKHREYCLRHTRKRRNTPAGEKHFRNQRLKLKYGITVEQYDQMLTNQNGVCACCGKPPGKRRLHVDHNHQTGQIRELLCVNCNVAIGNVKEDPKLLQRLAEYLMRHSSINY